VTLRGLTITASFTSISGVVQAVDDLPVTLEDVTVENAKPDGTGVGISTWVPMTVVGGVTVRTVNAQAAGWYALYATTNDGFITCQSPIAFEGYTTPCPSFNVSEGCGCP